MRTALFLLLVPLLALAEDSPFRNVTFQQLEFDLPGGKTILLKADGSVTWPKGAPSAETQAFCDALVTEKNANPATVNPRVNNDDNADASYDNAKAIADWNALVATLRAEGKPHADNTKQARAAWKMLRKLFPHVFNK